MSDYSDSMEFSSTRQTQVALPAKSLEIQSLVSQPFICLHEITGRSPSPKNSFTELYRTSTQAMIKRKEEMVKQDVEHPLPTENQVATEVVTPKTTLPHPIMLKIKKNFRAN
ncbi:hypothetical protein TNCV_3264021 [Trichonephila clavipes]|nr:hypothetical protein TNCV_3264021 [Trichonephila clavipes]